MKIKIKNLNHDEEITSLRHINPVFVSRYRQSMRNGDIFPPIVVERDSKIIVSGNTRVTAYREEFGEEHSVEAIVKTFPDRASLLEEAVRENAKHGNPLDGFSRRKFALKLLEHGREPGKIAQLFGVSVKRIEEWGELTVSVRGMGRQATKHGLEHISGKSVTKAEYETHEKADRGVPIVAQANQLIRWIENGWVDFGEEKTKDVLTRLHAAIQINL